MIDKHFFNLLELKASKSIRGVAWAFVGRSRSLQAALTLCDSLALASRNFAIMMDPSCKKPRNGWRGPAPETQAEPRHLRPAHPGL